jgi:hypothetical protein
MRQWQWQKRQTACTTRQKRVTGYGLWIPPAPCEFRNSRARAPPFVAPPSSAPGAWEELGVLLYIAFLGPRRWTLVSQRYPTSKCGFELEKRVRNAL